MKLKEKEEKPKMNRELIGCSSNKYLFDDEKPIGIGGNSNVYEVSGDVGKVVKIFKCDKKGQEYDQRLKRFKYEIEILKKHSKRLSHMVMYIDSGIDVPDGSPFIVMKKYTTYKDILYGEDSLAKKFSYANQLIEAIEEIHIIGLVHRDIKPVNLLFDEDVHGCHLFLNDYGLANGEGRDDELITFQNENIGSLGFRPPEFWGKNNDMTTNDYKFSDIYQCVKTIYCIFGNTKTPFPDGITYIGTEYEYDNSHYKEKPFVEPIYEMINEGIKNNFSERISLSKCKELLSEAQRMIRNNSYDTYFEYKRFLRRLFSECVSRHLFIFKEHSDINVKYEKLISFGCDFVMTTNKVIYILKRTGSSGDKYKGVIEAFGYSNNIEYSIDRLIAFKDKITFVIVVEKVDPPFNILAFDSQLLESEKEEKPIELISERKVSSFDVKDFKS